MPSKAQQACSTSPAAGQTPPVEEEGQDKRFCISDCSTSTSRQQGWDVSAQDRHQTQLSLSQPILLQVGYLGTQYTTWVHLPVGGAPRFFRSSTCEAITKTPWWVVPVLWTPIIASLLAHSLVLWRALPSTAMALVALGLLLWQLIEYSLHRFIFHAQPCGYWGITLHFLFHGCHHKFPTDHLRLVFPPVPAAAIAMGIWGALRLFVTQKVAMPIITGIIGGYLAYDCLHYCLHHGRRRPSTPLWLQALRSAHLHHHYCQPNSGFGISSPLFDVVLATLPVR